MPSLSVGVSVTSILSRVGGAVIPPVGDVVDNFGALTPAGAGGVSVTGTSIASGDPSGHWQISGGDISPSVAGEGNLTGSYSLTLDDSSTVELTVVANVAHSKVDQAETNACLTAIPTSGGTIRFRDNASYGLSDITLTGKAFTGTCTLEPESWTDNADPRLIANSCILPRLVVGANMENLTVRGFEVQHSASGLGTEAAIEIQAPCQNITITKNEIWDKSLETEFTSGRMVGGGMSLVNGVHCRGGSGTRQRVRVEDNYLHDVYRGILMVSTRQNGSSEPSRALRNYVINCYQYFTEGSSVQDTDYLDNRCYGLWAIPSDASSGIHMSVGGAFNPNCSNVLFAGNYMHEGTRRKELEPSFSSGATGVKFNDPAAGAGATAYQGIEVAFNLIVAATGAGIEVSGGSGVDIHHNTVVAERYQSPSVASIFLQDITNGRAWNNLANGFVVGVEDGTFTSEILPNNGGMLGYGNITVFKGNTEAFDDGQYFTGNNNPTPLSNLSLDDLEAIYTPVAGTEALDATQPKGALGHGLYLGSGTWSAAADWNSPVSAASGASSATAVTFDGSTNYLDWSGSTGEMIGSSRDFTIVTRLRRSATGVQYIFDTQAGRARLFMTADGFLEFFFEGSDDNIIITGRTGFNIPIDGNFHDVVIACRDEHIIAAKNGVLDPLFQVAAQRLEVSRRRSTYFAGNLWRIGAALIAGPANYFNGDMEFFWLSTEFADIEEDAAFANFFTSAGRLREPGATGTNYTGTQPEIFLQGGADSIATNLGTGPDFSAVGTFADVTDLVLTQMKAVTGYAAHARNIAGDYTITPTSYALSNAPAGFLVNSSGDVSWTPAANLDQIVTITATDAGSTDEVATMRLLATDAPIIIPAVGQSQFGHHEDPATAITYDNVFEWVTSAPIPAISPLDSGGTPSTNKGESISGAWAKLYDEAHPNDVIMLVNAYEGGTGVDDEWAHPSGANYTAAVAAVGAARAALPSATIPGVLGAHGGASDGYSEAQMRAAMDDFGTNFLSEIGADAGAWFVNGDIFNESTGTRPQLNQGIRNLSLERDRYGAIDWRTGLSAVDTTHLTDASKRIAAQRMFDATERLASPVAPNAPVASISQAGVVTLTWPFASETVNGDTRFNYMPFGGRVVTSVTVYYTVDGGAEQSITAAYAYGQTIPIPGVSSGDVIAVEATATNVIGTSGRGTSDSATIVANSTITFVADAGEIENLSPTGAINTIGNLNTSGAAVSDTLIVSVSLRDSGVEFPQITAAQFNGKACTVERETGGENSAVALVSFVLAADDIGAAVPFQITNTAATPLRIAADGKIYRSVDAIRTELFTNLTDPASLTMSFAIGGARLLVFSATSTTNAATATSLQLFGFNGQIGTFQHCMYVAYDGANAPLQPAADTTLTLAGYDDGDARRYYAIGAIIE